MELQEMGIGGESFNKKLGRSEKMTLITGEKVCSNKGRVMVEEG